MRQRSGIRRVGLLGALVLLVAGCGGGGGGAGAGANAATASGAVAQGVFSLLIYNVAGLPDPLSSSHPAVNTALISPLLNRYDVVLVQEDFWYHTELVSRLQHPYRSVPLTGQVQAVSDGLNRFSYFPLDPVVREPWRACHGMATAGSDCLSAKGFSYGKLQLGPGIEIDLYNVHADAGSEPGDAWARRLQFEQLRDAIARTSPPGRAVIVGGDTNLDPARPEDEAILQDFLAATGLVEVCRALGCPGDRIDRVMVRSGDRLEITPLQWSVAREFVDAQGRDLSDHEAVRVDLGWRYRPAP